MTLTEQNIDYLCRLGYLDTHAEAYQFRQLPEWDQCIVIAVLTEEFIVQTTLTMKIIMSAKYYTNKYRKMFERLD